MFPFKKKSPPFTRADMLSGKPVRLIDTPLETDAQGGARLTVPLKPRAAQKWFLRFPEGSKKTFELDAIGVFVWNLCDGKTSVQSLISKLAKHLKISSREAEV